MGLLLLGRLNGRVCRLEREDAKGRRPRILSETQTFHAMPDPLALPRGFGHFCSHVARRSRQLALGGRRGRGKVVMLECTR